MGWDQRNSYEFVIPRAARSTEHSGGTFGAATTRSTNWCEGYFWSDALQKVGGRRVTHSAK